jgi:branched-chain amino acid transport system substrate-binding protein
MRTRLKSATVLAAVSVGTLGLAACGSSSHSTSNTTASAATSGGTTGTTAAAPTGSTLAFGTVESVTGSPGATGRITAATDILDAWAKQVNASGGLDGHQVKIYATNDNADPAQAKADLTTLYKQDHVLAIVGEDASSTEPGWKAQIDSYKLPVIGGTAYSANWFTDPNFYPGTATVVSNVWGEVYAAQKAVPGAKMASLLCSNSSVCQGAVSIQSAAAKQLGVPVVYNQTADAAAASYTPQCLAMKEAGANVIEPQGINDVNLIRDCKQQGYTPVVITENYDPLPSQIKANPSLLAGLVGPAPAFNPGQEFPQTMGYFNLLKAYAPQYLPGGSQYGANPQGAVDAYVATQIVTQALTNAGVTASTPVTSATLVQGLSKFHNETLGGISPPLTYGNGTAPNPQIYCFYEYKTTSTLPYFQEIPANTLQLYCQPPGTPTGS